MLEEKHIRKAQMASRERTSLKFIDLIIENKRSFATASTEEVNARAYLQRIRLQECKQATAADEVRHI